MNLKEQLIEKMEAEFEHFHSWLLEQPPEEILDLAYDYLTKQDILMNLEDTDLSPRRLRRCCVHLVRWRMCYGTAFILTRLTTTTL